VLAAGFTRSALKGVRWADADAAQVVNETSDELVTRPFGATKELVALDLTKEPEIAAVLDAVDPAELG
jgi:hypothetical protein